MSDLDRLADCVENARACVGCRATACSAWVAPAMNCPACRRNIAAAVRDAVLADLRAMAPEDCARAMGLYVEMHKTDSTMSGYRARIVREEAKPPRGPIPIEDRPDAPTNPNDGDMEGWSAEDVEAPP